MVSLQSFLAGSIKHAISLLKVMKNIFIPHNNYVQKAEIQQGGEEPLLFSGKRWFCSD